MAYTSGETWPGVDGLKTTRDVPYTSGEMWPGVDGRKTTRDVLFWIVSNFTRRITEVKP